MLRREVVRVSDLGSPITYNDIPRRTHAQVLRLLDRAIARREKALAA